MATYKKSSMVSGAWIKVAELGGVKKAKIVSETNPQASQFQNKDGSPKTQDVCKVRFEGKNDVYNLSLNKTTINGLIEAFGEDSKEWINKVLEVLTEKAIVGGKRVTILYLVPEGFELKENDGFMAITKKGAVEKEVESFDEKTIEYPQGDEIGDATGIPF